MSDIQLSLKRYALSMEDKMAAQSIWVRYELLVSRLGNVCKALLELKLGRFAYSSSRCFLFRAREKTFNNSI